MPPGPERLICRVLQPLRVGLVIVLLSWRAALAANCSDEFGIEAGPLQDPQLELAERTVFKWIFDGATSPRAVQNALDRFLLERIAIVDRVCRLTDAQNEKLRLAGLGDNRRLLDRFREMARQLDLVQNDPDKENALTAEAKQLKWRLGPCLSNPLGDSSVFFKSLETMLTPEQLATYQSLKVVVHAGGKVELLRRDSDEGLEISFLFTRSAFADDDLAQLTRLTGIISLILAETQVTDAGLSHLNGLKRLKTLWLDKTRITDAGLSQLKDLPKLQYLLLARTNVTDAGLAHLKELTTLKQITLDGTQVTDAGLVHLKGLADLRTLLLRETGVTDAGLVHLRRLTRLQSLDLDKTGVTDGGLAHLKVLSALRTLSLQNTDVTDAGVSDLQLALPSLKITR